MLQYMCATRLCRARLRDSLLAWTRIRTDLRKHIVAMRDIVPLESPAAASISSTRATISPAWLGLSRKLWWCKVLLWDIDIGNAVLGDETDHSIRSRTSSATSDIRAALVTQRSTAPVVTARASALCGEAPESPGDDPGRTLPRSRRLSLANGPPGEFLAKSKFMPTGHPRTRRGPYGTDRAVVIRALSYSGGYSLYAVFTLPELAEQTDPGEMAQTARPAFDSWDWTTVLIHGSFLFCGVHPWKQKVRRGNPSPNKHIDPLNLRIWKTSKNIRLRASGFNDSVFSGGGDSLPIFTKILGRKAERGHGKVSLYGSWYPIALCIHSSQGIFNTKSNKRITTYSQRKLLNKKNETHFTVPILKRYAG
ncbi:hypothetical protein BZA77DRAFT_348139 [Pyronema omphalodes]|nr:hypothetical protein BZA77DRAFT_348139 [Pyronema omphalodes]